jgi:hypothetical protein
LQRILLGKRPLASLRFEDNVRVYFKEIIVKHLSFSPPSELIVSLLRTFLVVFIFYFHQMNKINV